ncbi:MAG TPA: zinc-ribbon domain containing protein [Candidatus Nitrosotenuis sp.]|jgi:CxxC-x17-CxxC domain-containing protein|nr:zinc-ribbon domain containing protein [Candidatus Nitrosotenuis sp.]
MPAFRDRTLTCADCGTDFIFTAGEQEFHASKGFTSEPRRCPSCRAARKAGGERRESSGFGGGRRPMYDAVCAACGQKTQVPFQPTGSRPVYCSDCFSRQGGGFGGSRDRGERGGGRGGRRDRY